ncbi:MULTISPECIES: arylformamidase [Metabacillus]|uniref:Kynurenine formamidase n=2 Tax=Metabacillus TaxID=2675233 RepID=A0A179SMF1_9BACI|nr:MULTISPECIES: arylformamidase [Metabacillus]OAS82120.1 arylformamidase [Metabacillus litoralis]QNF29786.1 arylformamidase [Metabacillus sp. KUDC1714]
MTSEKWIDISQPLREDIAHWPGDTPFSYEVVFRKSETGSVNIGKMVTSLHTGTHIDAPFHFLENGTRVTDLDINIFIGPCLVIDVSQHELIDVEVLKKFEIKGSKRILLRTSARRDLTVFPKKIPLLTLEAIDYLKNQDITLIGIDLPSVDQIDSKELPIHHRIYKHGIYILENVLLDHIKPGKYELSALPLPIEYADGSLVRAAVRPLSNKNGVGV